MQANCPLWPNQLRQTVFDPVLATNVRRGMVLRDVVNW